MSNEEIGDIYEKLNDIHTSVQVMGERVNVHLDEHKRVRELWYGVLRGVMVAVALGGGGVFIIGLKVWLEK